MGYTSDQITISLRLERHNVEGDRLDNEAARRLRNEIDMLIAADPDYERVAILVWGPGV